MRATVPVARRNAGFVRPEERARRPRVATEASKSAPRAYIMRMTDRSFPIDRRMLMLSGTATVAAALLGRSSAVTAPLAPHARSVGTVPPSTSASVAPASFDPTLLRKALAALDRHTGAVVHRDRIAIVDFSAPSSEARLHFLDVIKGERSSLLVAHGAGSDPGHTGFLQRFSNDFGSNASSEGAFLTGDYYVGKHGRSQRLAGLDPTNDNARGRAIVIHSAWYANADILAAHGKLGRSQGCFAVGEHELDRVFGFLGEGRLLYAAKA